MNHNSDGRGQFRVPLWGRKDKTQPLVVTKERAALLQLVEADRERRKVLGLPSFAEESAEWLTRPSEPIAPLSEEPVKKRAVPTRSMQVTLHDDGAQKSLPFRLTGSQAKTAFALRHNCETMLAGNSDRVLASITDKDGVARKVWQSPKPENLNCAAFLTLTIGDETPDGFQQVWDAAEASRRFNNLNRHVLSGLFERAIVVSERHKSGAIHFHLVGVLKGRPDIRTGFDFQKFHNALAARAKGTVNTGAEVRYKMSASPALSALWERMRDVLPGYGFGRAQLTPLEKTGEAVACYVSKYIEKNICNRRTEDRHKKLVRYLGEWKVMRPDGESYVGRTPAWACAPCPSKLRPNDFAWAGRRAVAWRGKASELFGLINVVDRGDAAVALGPRWAFKVTRLWQRMFGDDLCPFFKWNFPERELARTEMSRMAGAEFCRRSEEGTVNRVLLAGVWFEPDELQF